MAASVLSVQSIGALGTTKLLQLRNADKRVTAVSVSKAGFGFLKEIRPKNVSLASNHSALHNKNKHWLIQSTANGQVRACNSGQLATQEGSTSGVKDNVGESERWTSGRNESIPKLSGADFQTFRFVDEEPTFRGDQILLEDAPSEAFSSPALSEECASMYLEEAAQHVALYSDERAALEAAFQAPHSFESHLTDLSSGREEDIQPELLDPLQKLQDAFLGTAKFLGALLLASALALASPQSALAARSMGRAGGGGFSSSRSSSSSSSRSSSSTSSRSTSSSSHKSSSPSSSSSFKSSSSSFSSRSSSPSSSPKSSGSSSSNRSSSSGSSGGHSSKSSSSIAKHSKGKDSKKKGKDSKKKGKDSKKKGKDSRNKSESKSARRSGSPSRWRVWNRTNSATQVVIDKDQAAEHHYMSPGPHVGGTGHHSSYYFIQTHSRPTTTDRLVDALLGRVRSEETLKEEQKPEQKEESTGEKNTNDDAFYAFRLAILVVLAVWFVFFLIDLERVGARSTTSKRYQSGNENPGEKSYQGLSPETAADNLITIVKIQVALLGQAKSVQRQMDKLCEETDTSSKEGLHHLLQESLLVLLRHSAYWAYGRSQTIALGYDAAEGKYQQMALEERAKAEQETLVNRDGKIERMPSLRGENDDLTPNEYIVVTILAAVKGWLRTPDSASTQRTDVVAAIHALSGSKSDDLEVLEVLWVPQEDDDTLTHNELLEKYTDLNPL